EIDGDWDGGFLYQGQWVTVTLHLGSASRGFEGTGDIDFTDYEGERGVTLTAATRDGSRIHFGLPTDRGAVAFDGRLAGGTISGRYRLGMAAGTFGASRVVALTSADRALLFGAYRLGPNHILSVFDFYGGTLRCIDYRSGRQNTLYTVADDSLI